MPNTDIGDSKRPIYALKQTQKQAEVKQEKGDIAATLDVYTTE